MIFSIFSKTCTEMSTLIRQGLEHVILFFRVLSGVRTGCPASATLFVLCMNPFVDLFIRLSDGPKLSSTCLCADDVGSALRALKSPKYQFSIFSVASKVSNMVLKPAKCVLIITCIDLTDEVRGLIKAWLRDHIPEWQDFKIASAGKYLVVFLGKSGGALTYRAPVEKFFERSNELADAGAPSVTTIIRYNERVASVFSYVSQVVPPPLPELAECGTKRYPQNAQAPP